MPDTFTFPPYQRPTKIEWLLPISNQDWISAIKSKSTQKLAVELDEIIEKANLQITVAVVTPESFAAWLPYYAAKMTEQGHNVIATPEWLQTKQAAGIEVYSILYYQNGQLVGSSICSKNDAGKHIEHFKASDSLNITNLKNASLGTIIDLYFIKTAVKSNANSISSGSSRNAFGYFNTLGYLGFKIKLGYVPTISELGTIEADFVPATEEPCIWFMTQDNETLEVLTTHQDKISSEIMGLVEQLGLKITNK